ncbi:EamA family transporter [Geminisphaera colitermitum]|uniref:EamA family transporter n=1 Tax=Geminisphaera colitermitum TaxID=1148786 RepID=UPI000158CA9B|nr:EamA family transporter [Geminisphaera colitermitum]
MIYLLLVSLIWAFSFGLIKGQLAGLDPDAVSVARLGLALLVFLPFWRPRAVAWSTGAWLAVIGAVEFGAMYVLYLRAFAYIDAYQVALFTILTPIFVTLLDAALDDKFHSRHLLAAAVSVAGAGVAVWTREGGPNLMIGFALVQGSNLCFAAGQVAYKRTRPALPADVSNASLFGWLYLGAVAAALVASFVFGNWSHFHPTPRQWGVLAYLGALASGVCFFWWNLGALRANTGTLAVFNNAKIPLGIACSLLFFGEHASLWRLGASLALLAAGVAIAEWRGGTGPKR